MASSQLHIDEQLPDFVLGTLTSEEMLAVEMHLAGCRECMRIFKAMRDVPEALAEAVSAAGSSSATENASLLSRIRGEKRFGDFVNDVAKLLDISAESARSLLNQLHHSDVWQEGPTPGVEIFPVQAGRRFANALASFVRMKPGATFPSHIHSGREATLVLQGGFREATGEEVWPGDLLNRGEGTSHGFTAIDGPDCITVTVIDGELQFIDEQKGLA